MGLTPPLHPTSSHVLTLLKGTLQLSTVMSMVSMVPTTTTFLAVAGVLHGPRRRILA